jgi:hypothetical protein
MSRKDGKRPKTSGERERTERLQVILPTEKSPQSTSFDIMLECRAGRQRFASC